MSSSPETMKMGGSALRWHVTLAALVGAACAAIWVVTGGSFWPRWVWVGLAILVGIHFAARRGRRDPRRTVIEVAALSAPLFTTIWAFSGGGYFWPAWPLGAIAVAAVWVYLQLGNRAENDALSERVDELSRTRRGAVDVQADNLRRIERDLHDGAQARLVALSMHLGRAEARLEDQPEMADVLRHAREEATSAIQELRDLARGIAPPVLADRGLEAALDGLARRSAVPVVVTADVPRRPPAVVESAAYFVAAEGITNASKHAGGVEPIRVLVDLLDTVLIVEVVDQGKGGADAEGSGLSGLRSRVEAIDGRFELMSPPNGGTVVRAELPCV